jgi:hypothetical protein
MFAARVFTVAELAHAGERAAILTDQRIRFPRGTTRYSAAGPASASATSSAGIGV